MSQYRYTYSEVVRFDKVSTKLIGENVSEELICNISFKHTILRKVPSISLVILYNLIRKTDRMLYGYRF